MKHAPPIRILARAFLATLVATALTLLITAPLAFAQTGAAPQAPAPLAALNPSTVTIALLAAVAAFVVNAWQSGKIVGIGTVPAAWLPYLGATATFLLADSASLSAAGSVTALSLVNGALQGFYALLAYGIGAGAHVSMMAHFRQHVSCGRGGEGGGSGTVVTALPSSALSSVKPPPAPKASARTRILVPAMSVGAMALGLAVMAPISTTGCKGASFPVFMQDLGQVATTVLGDVDAGDPVTQVESDVAHDIGQDIADGGGASAELVLEATRDGIQILLDFDRSNLSPQVVAVLETLLGEENAKLAKLVPVATDGGVQ